MPIRVYLLDSDGGLVSTYSRSVTLRPGQVTAIVGYEGDATGATQMDVVVANGETDWTQLTDTPGDLTFSQVKPKVSDDGTKTTGRIRSTFDQQVEGIGVNVLYPDAAGQVVAADNGWVEFVPAASEASFMVEGWSEKKPDIATTEVYYDGFLPATE